MNYFKLFLGSLGWIYFIFCIISKQRFPKLSNFLSDKYIFFDLLSSLTLLYLILKLNKYVALLPLGLLIYCYRNSLNSQDKIWFSTDGLISGILLTITTYLK